MNNGFSINSDDMSWISAFGFRDPGKPYTVRAAEQNISDQTIGCIAEAIIA
jgi:hypothetical protein